MTFILKRWRVLLVVLLIVLLLALAAWLIIEAGIEKVPTKGVFV